MTIKRSGIGEPVNNRLGSTHEIPTYCPNCAKNGIRDHDTILKPRLDYFAYDADQWRQCYHCGSIIGKPDIAQPGELHTDIEVINTKFRRQNAEDPEHYEPPKHRRGFNERLDRKGEIADDEVKAALKKGARLLSYTES